MNTSFPEAIKLAKEIMAAQTNDEVIKIFFPPYIFLHEVTEQVKQKTLFFTGAQNCSEFEKGAYTGEISATMINSIGCKYVLVGHSERRLYFNENAHQLKSKIEQALKHNLHVVFCFGEQLSERKSNLHVETVNRQLTEVLENFNGEQLNNIILAYEPVWAIGTGETASPQQAQEMHAKVRDCIEKLFGSSIASNISILYGGSCNPANAKELFACKDVDGGLIGGASLKADDFCKIINSF